MPIFTLPLSASNGQIATSHSTPTTKSHSIGRKRRRAPSPAPTPASGSQTPAQNDPFASPEPTGISTHIANPLSLNDDERAQYIAAGLPLDTELPSKTYTQFPHKQLPDDAIIDDGGWTTAGETETESRKKRRNAEGKTGRRSHMRVRHLGVLTAIVQRCLQEGDIPRATKAFSLLLRAQIGGRGVDLRTANYWGIGAELLIRAGEMRPIGKKPLASISSSEPQEIEASAESEGIAPSERRWGTKSGTQQAKAYYERLILQHPYMRQFASNSLSSLDFWPAMIGIEIYGIQHEYTTSLNNLSSSELLNDDDEDGYQSPLREDMTFEEQERSEARQEKRLEAKKKERDWEAQEAIRTRTLTTAKDIQKRLDELMTGPPWTDSGVMLRLRGCVNLWIGDLSMPTPFEDREHEDEMDEDWDDEQAARRVLEEELQKQQKATGRRFAVEQGKHERKEAYEAARTEFVQAKRRGMDVPDVEWEEVLGEDEPEPSFE